MTLDYASIQAYLSQPEIFLKTLAVLIAFVATITDLTKGKIYNWLTLPTILAGWSFNYYFYGISGLWHSFLATLLGIFLYLFFAALGVIGMGDVKLMGAIGSLCGSVFALNIFLYTSVLGIPHAFLIQYLNYGKDALGMFVASFSTKAFLNKTIQQENQDTKKKYRFLLGIDIFIATLLAFFFIIRIHK